MSRAKVHRVKTFLVTPSGGFGAGAERSFGPAARGFAPTTRRPSGMTRGSPRPRRGTRRQGRALRDRSTGRTASVGPVLSRRRRSRELPGSTREAVQLHARVPVSDILGYAYGHEESRATLSSMVA